MLEPDTLLFVTKLQNGMRNEILQNASIEIMDSPKSLQKKRHCPEPIASFIFLREHRLIPPRLPRIS